MEVSVRTPKGKTVVVQLPNGADTKQLVLDRTERKGLPPNPNGGAQLKSISFAIAKETFFVTTDTTLLELVLRPGNAMLSENAGFQSVIKEIPERVSGMSFIRPDESARLTYDFVKSGQIVGSRLIGQSFSDPKYFWSRPSATSPQPYNGLASSGSNLGPEPFVRG